MRLELLLLGWRGPHLVEPLHVVLIQLAYLALRSVLIVFSAGIRSHVSRLVGIGLGALRTTLPLVQNLALRSVRIVSWIFVVALFAGRIAFAHKRAWHGPWLVDLIEAAALSSGEMIGGDSFIFLLQTNNDL